jgi:hypothetical protein
MAAPAPSSAPVKPVVTPDVSRLAPGGMTGTEIVSVLACAFIDRPPVAEQRSPDHVCDEAYEEHPQRRAGQETACESTAGRTS